MLTIEEFREIRDFVSSKGISLMVHENKCNSRTGFPMSNYTEYQISNEKYYTISTNTFIEIIHHEILKLALNKNPEKFGTGNAHDVIEAVLLATKTELNGIYMNYKDRLPEFIEFLKNQHCYVVKRNLNGQLDEKILRIDLFRKIELSKTKHNTYDFTGGLFHSFKHFSINEINLSVGNDKAELYHPIRIIDFTINALFGSDLSPLSKRNKFTSYSIFNSNYKLKFIFHFENNTKVYFIDTIRKDKIKQ